KIGDKLEFAQNRPIANRSIEQYEDDLKIPITKEFLGENVLDLGSGLLGYVAKEAAKRGIKIFSLSPDFSNPRFKNYLKEIRADMATSGLAQELPYKDNIFDSVLSVGAIPIHLPRTERDHVQSFAEIIRVLKPGGKAFLSPINNPEYLAGVDYDMDAIKKMGAFVEQRPISAKEANGTCVDSMLIITKPEENK
ncbi:MAG: class I SAM-dependent methyltransferase, partial [Candidatus Portnoybacteria bacterium]|nr:class I SAM-dependent methyltransferase [Candidatus Portnoybacteria bacterium]